MASQSRSIGAAAIAALGLSSLSPVQQGAALVVAGAAALGTAPAMAAGKLKGKITGNGDKGTIIRSLSTNAAIIAPSDANGEVRLTGLEPGAYNVQVVDGTQRTEVRVGPDGRLAFATWQEIQRAEDGDRRALPAVHRWAEQIAFDLATLGDGAVFDLRAIRRMNPIPCAPTPPGVTPACGVMRNFIDINASSPQEMVRVSPGLSMQSAVHIMVQREKGGAYTSIEDLARRNCPFVAINMSGGAVKVAEATVMLAPSTGKLIVPGLQCQPRDGGQFSLYGKKHNYVGHVTLLR